jgi:hypothetical protein
MRLLVQTFRSECTTLINQADAAKLIRKVLEHREAILAFDKEESIEGCFAVLFQFLHRTENPEQVSKRLHAASDDNQLLRCILMQ